MQTCHILARPLSMATATMQFIKAEIHAGLKPFVICPDGPRSFLDECPEVTIVHLATPPITTFSPAQSLQFVNMILDTLRRYSFDVVIVYDFRGCGLLPLRGKNISKTWLLNIRNSNLHSIGWRAKFADKMTFVETYAYKAVLVCDTGIGQQLLGKRPFHVLPNGADLQKFTSSHRTQTRKELGYSDADEVIIYIGTLASRRRPVRILETFAKVAAVRPEARLLMVGQSDQLPKLIVWGHEHQLADRITFTGRVPYDVIHNYLAAADIGFAYYPGLETYKANIPLKTAELLAASLPTVATNTLGNRLYITHEENGLLAEDEPAELAKVILRLWDEPDLTERLRNHAQPSVSNYDWQQIVYNKLLPLYMQYATS